MARSIAIDAPLSSGIRRTKNFKRTPVKKSTGGIKKRPSGARTPTRPARPQGGKVRSAVPSARRNAPFIPSNDNREVRINLSNLAPSVLSSDLRQLFAEFRLKDVSVNFNEKGKPVGTGDITLSKRHADGLIKKFTGVALDGKEMKFALIDTSNIANRVKFPDAPKRTPSVGRPTQRPLKKQNVKQAGQQQKKLKAKKPKREAPPKKTVEELDAELDAYMSHAN